MKPELNKIVENTDIYIVSTKKCIYCLEEFPLYNIEKEQCDSQNFIYAPQCSECTFKMLYSYINDRHLYHRKDSKTWKNIISLLSEGYEGEVIDAHEYKNHLTDDYGLQYGRIISGDYLKNFKKLYQEFPKPSRLVFPDLENADYASHCWWSKNLYLSYCVFMDCEDIYYSHRIVWWSKKVFNSYEVTTSSMVHFSYNVWRSFNIFYSHTIIDGSNLLFCREMNNCNDCIFCCNQVNKKYMVYNIEYTKEEYKNIESDIKKRIKNYTQFQFLEKKYEEFLEKNLVIQSLDSHRCEKVVGETVYDSTHSINCYNGIGLENCVNIMTWWNDTHDTNIQIMNSVEFWTHCENVIWSCSFWVNIYNTFFSNYLWNVSNVYYSIDIQNCEEVLLCVWLKNKKYCIFNKIYEKEDYFTEKKKIILELQESHQWWEFLWFDMSLYPYNDTLAYNFFRVHTVIDCEWKETLIDAGARWVVTVSSDTFISDAILDLWWKKIKIKWRTQTKEINIPENADVIVAKDLPNIDTVDNSILDKVILCEVSGRPFRIVQWELEFLQKKWLPLPRIHHEERIDRLMAIRPMWKMYTIQCDKCQSETLSVFQRKPRCKLYCQKCYKEFMY